MKRLFLLLVLIMQLVISTTNVFAISLKINEISICNISNEMDSAYNYTGWIEVYNSSDIDINLKDLYFSDDAAIAKKYKLGENRVVKANDFGLIWLNDEVKDGKGLFLDTDPDGGVLLISDNTGVLIDKLIYPKQYTNISYGRLNESSTVFGYFQKSTIKATNSGQKTANAVVATPTFSLPGGFYTSQIEVNLNCATSNAKMYYTLDGSDPDTLKTLYSGNPIVISKTTPLRVKAYAADYLNGVIATSTYMIDERIPDMPVIFLTTDSMNLYDDSIGIYCIGQNGIVQAGIPYPANFNRDWTRPGNVEFFDKTKNPILNQQAGISISGNATRAYAQKSFKIKTSKKYGKSRFNYSFFADKKNQNYKSFLLRNGGQDFPYGSLRDAFLQRMSSILNLDYQAVQPAVVYINGVYWGYMNIRERHNEDYLLSNYGIQDTAVDIIENNWLEEVSNGNFVAYNEMKAYILNHDLSIDSVYEKVKDYIDIDSYLNYMAVELFCYNDDWPNNNQKLYRERANGKWRWILQDLDNCYKWTNQNKLQELIESSNNAFSIKMITYLLKNDEFKNNYIDNQCLVAGSVFNSIRTDSILNIFKADIETEWPYHAEKWGRIFLWHNYFLENIDEHKLYTELLRETAFKNLRTNFNLDTTYALTIYTKQKTAQIDFNGLTVPALPYNGMYFAHRQLKLEAQDYVGEAKFDHWRISGMNKDSICYNRELILFLSDSTDVEAIYSVPPLSKRSGLYINEISADNSVYVDNYFKKEDWIELYNNSDKALDLNGLYLSNDPYLLTKHALTSSLIIPPFGYKVLWCSAAPSRGANHLNFKLQKEGGILLLSGKNKNGVVEILDSLTYTLHSSIHTFGRYPDGSDNLFLLNAPTIASKNVVSNYNTLVSIQNNQLVTGISKLVLDKKMSIYTDDEWLYLNAPSPVKAVVELFTLSGSLVKREAFSGSNYVVNIASLIKGVYLIRISTNEGVESFKWLKQDIN